MINTSVKVSVQLLVCLRFSHRRDVKLQVDLAACHSGYGVLVNRECCDGRQGVLRW